MAFDPARLREALDRIPQELWSLPSSYRATGAHHGYRRLGLVSAGNQSPHAHLFEFVLDALEPVRDAWLSWIEPGGFIVSHRDGGPYRERWQVPILAGDFDGSATEPGVAFPVEHWKPHRVTVAESPRVHIVIDRNVLVDVPSQAFAITEEAEPCPSPCSDPSRRSSLSTPTG